MKILIIIIALMSAIHSFARSGMWDYRNIIAPTAVALPLAIEGGLFIKNIICHPGYLQETCRGLKNRFVNAFTQRADETTAQAVRRIAKNTFILIACLALMAGAAYASIYFLPGAIGIVAAVSAIYCIGKLFLNRGRYKRELIQMFTPKPGEEPEVAKRRIFFSYVKASLVIGALAGAILIGAFILPPLLEEFSWTIALPFQTKVVVFLEYAAVGVLHSALAAYKYCKGDKAGAAFHAAAAVASIAFPIFYWNNDMRLHHSFLGLSLMLLPSRTAKILGTMITFDASLYMLEPLRGAPQANGTFLEYDFMNVIVDNFPLFFEGMMGAALLGDINDNWSKTPKKEPKQAPPV